MTQIAEEKLLSTKAGRAWQKVGIKHHHGINCPLFSLHTQNSCGIGEYLDLIPLLEWCKEIGFDVIQLLPLNDTGKDQSPYNALSANALNPIYLSMTALPNAGKVAYFDERIKKLRDLNFTKRVEYSKVGDLKTEFLNDYFEKNAHEILEHEEYKNFVQQNGWIEPYALFKAIKEDQNWKPWEEWPQRMKSPSLAGIKDLAKEFERRMNFHKVIQYLCFQQMKEVKRKADELGMLVKGDLPILISRDSADVWSERSNFLLHLSAGSPPDAYSKTGQNWGLPLYDWKAHETSGYHFWKTRLQVAEKLYHLFRLDHIVGFYRIWGIPLNKSPLEGSFVPPDESIWIAHGNHIMEMMLQSTEMLPIGEDLGVVPPIVRANLTELGIPGTKMMRWERRWEGDGGFIPFSEYTPISMTTVTTQDSETLQLWWQHAPKEAKLFAEFKGWKYRPFLSKEQHREILYDSHHSSSLFHINLLNEYLALFPDFTSSYLPDERINIPGQVNPNNWTYRFRKSLEDLRSYPPLTTLLKEML